MIFPLSDGVLEYYQFIRAPVIKFITGIDGKYNANCVLTLKTDVLDKSRIDNDYCLGKVNEANNEWNCVTNAHIKNTDGRFSYYIQEDGIYSVLYYPSQAIASAVEEDCDTYCQYKREITFSAIIFALIVVIILYIFWRMLRYVFKYRKSKKHRE